MRIFLNILQSFEEIRVLIVDLCIFIEVENIVDLESALIEDHGNGIKPIKENSCTVFWIVGEVGGLRGVETQSSVLF